MTHKKGFTLIEVMIVVSIIAVLAVLAMFMMSNNLGKSSHFHKESFEALFSQDI
jgi:prepilin-type N-terminal cleavage/methylation domain-containing protein